MDNINDRIQKYVLIFQEAFEKIFGCKVEYDSDISFFEMDKLSGIGFDPESICLLEKATDSLFEEYHTQKEHCADIDAHAINYVLDEVIIHLKSNHELALSFYSSLLSKSKALSEKYHENYYFFGLYTLFYLFDDCIHKGVLTKKQKENFYNSIFVKHVDVLSIENYKNMHTYYLDKSRRVAEYLPFLLSILTKYTEYESQIINAIKLLVYKNDNQAATYSYNMDLSPVNIDKIPDCFFEAVNVKALLVIRNSQGKDSPFHKKLDNYILKNYSDDKSVMESFAIYTAITLDMDYIRKTNKRMKECFMFYLSEALEKVKYTSHIIYQCEDFIKRKGLEMDVRKEGFWKQDFYPLIEKYIEE